MKLFLSILYHLQTTTLRRNLKDHERSKQQIFIPRYLQHRTSSRHRNQHGQMNILVFRANTMVNLFEGDSNWAVALTRFGSRVRQRLECKTLLFWRHPRTDDIQFEEDDRKFKDYPIGSRNERLYIFKVSSIRAAKIRRRFTYTD